MIRNGFLLMLSITASSPGLSSPPVGQPQPAATREKAEDKIVCRFVNSTGSRLSRQKECKTRANWNRESDETQDDFARQSTRATGDATNAPH